ncbi:MAG: amino acid ABC transporter substrate-binding protein [Alphaproteobacteria bacterium]|nr:amino acid ABC transporter substrate-binding protein [Alphaproteobacteria bacterium]
MKKTLALFITLFAAVLFLKFYIIKTEGAGTGQVLGWAIGIPLAHAADKEKESVYDRVMRTGTIRCGYGQNPPYTVVDLNTGKVTGIHAEIMDAIGESLSLEIEWTQEVPWDQMPAALQTKKIDMLCSGFWVTGARGRQIAFTRPLYFNAIEAVVRTDDTRFDNNLLALNDPEITIATDDNDVGAKIAATDFPLARKLVSPQLASVDYLLMNVANGKADATIMYTSYVHDFMTHNPGKLRAIKAGKPLRIFGTALGVSLQEQMLRDMIDSALLELQGSGILDKILDRYEKDYPGYFFRTAKPYEVSE